MTESIREASFPKAVRLNIHTNILRVRNSAPRQIPLLYTKTALVETPYEIPQYLDALTDRR